MLCDQALQTRRLWRHDALPAIEMENGLYLIRLGRVEAAGAHPLGIDGCVSAPPSLREKSVDRAADPVRVLSAHRLRGIERPVDGSDKLKLRGMAAGNRDEDRPRLVRVQAAAPHFVEHDFAHRGQLRSDPARLSPVGRLQADLQNPPSFRAASREPAPPAIYRTATHKMRTDRHV